MAGELAAEAMVRGIDLRVPKPDDVHMTIEAKDKGAWHLVFQGRLNNRLSAFLPVHTTQLRVKLSRASDKLDGLEIQELRVVRASDS